MQLTRYTDYSLRMLVALGVSDPERISVAQISRAYRISHYHLVKVARHLAQLGYVETIRGKGGGMRLARTPGSIRIGEVVRRLEPGLGVVECLRPTGTSCVIMPACRLKALMRRATVRFLDELDKCTLDEVLTSRNALRELLNMERVAAVTSK